MEVVEYNIIARFLRDMINLPQREPVDTKDPETDNVIQVYGLECLKQTVPIIYMKFQFQRDHQLCEDCVPSYRDDENVYVKLENVHKIVSNPEPLDYTCHACDAPIFDSEPANSCGTCYYGYVSLFDFPENSARRVINITKVREE